MSPRFLLFLMLLVQGLSSQVMAESYNRVDFQVEASREVSNDLLSTTLSVEMQDPQPAKVAQHLNSVLNNALKRADSFKSVKVSSGNQNTYPVYGAHNHIDAWRGHAELHIESNDFKAAGELIMQLQKEMQLSNVQFTLAAETRKTVETELTATALKTFQARAESIRVALGAKSYKTLHLAIHDGAAPSPYPIAMLRGAIAADSAIPTPDFASGDTKMSIQIEASIELQ